MRECTSEELSSSQMFPDTQHSGAQHFLEAVSTMALSHPGNASKKTTVGESNSHKKRFPRTAHIQTTQNRRIPSEALPDRLVPAN
mmetsp:Transcript_18004/g.29684  ORF Transcript_18004/g.29684 Transcript_18004/m.29684 type:complete len:85 (+) Transcript_18004:201-455(+)